MNTKTKISYNEKFNWLMHHLYVTKNFHHCKQMADQVDVLSKSNSEYAGSMKGKLARVDGHVQSSLKHYQAASAINPGNVENIKQVAKSFTLMRMHKQALSTYDHAESISDGDWEVAHHKAQCHFIMNDHQNAIRYVSKALESKEAGRSLTLEGRIRRAQGDQAAALQAFEKALKVCADDSDLLCSMALLCLERGDKSNAFNYASTCLALNKQHLGGMLVLGNILQSEGSGDIALNKYKLLTPWHSDSAALWNNLSLCFLAKNKLIATVTCLKRSSFLSPFDAAGLYNSALVHASMHLYASAFQFVSLSLALKFKSSQLLLVLAVIMTNLQDLESAEQAYKKALELDSKDPTTLGNYAVLLLRKGQVSQAREAVLVCKQHLKENNPTFTEIKELISKLEKRLNVSN